VTDSPWLRPWNDVPRPRVRLVCLPHAGGTAQAFQTWPAGLPDDVQVIGVQYPGRQDRFGEPFATDVDGLAGPVAAALAPLPAAPLVLFGHSMGAAVAYEVAVLLERRFGRVVDLLAVSGALPPQVARRTRVFAGGADEIVADVRRRNPGVGPLLDIPGLLEVLVPVFRADYRVSETYHRPEPVKVRADLLVLGGTEDPDVSVESLKGWTIVASGRSTTRTIRGGHFYLAEDETEFLEAFSAHLP
jgi:pyochelin biosynthetic protein PchC